MRLFPALLLTSALATAAAGAVVLVDPGEGSRPGVARQATAPEAQRVAARPDPDDPRTWQTSDQVPGEIAREVRPGERVTLSRTRRYTFRAAPGVSVTGWDARTRRGPLRYHVMRVKWRTRGISVDYAHGGRVRNTQTVTNMVGRTPGGVAGVNGDFFDIYDTGAPLGVAHEHGGTFWKGITSGWNNSLSVNTSGQWHVGRLPMVASVKERPDLLITNYNAPRVVIGGIGVYDWRWGRSVAVRRWVDGQRRQVRWAHVVDGKVVANRQTDYPPEGSLIEGVYLIARGDKAEDKLESLEVGTRVTVQRRLAGDVAMAISGNALLLKKRQVLATDDRELHPRTAVGVDRDDKELIFLVVDGRQSFSRGHTMVELARLLKRLGAEDALNLDGGGSTTLVARREGRLRILNSPSDGRQRRVPNGLEVVYRRPAG